MAANRQAIDAGQAAVTLSTNDAPMRAGLVAAEKTFKAWGQTIATVGASITAASAAVMAPFLHGLSVASDWGREAQTAMRETGLSFREFDTLSDGMRVGAEELVPAIAHVSAHLNQAANGSREAVQTFEMLGISIDGLISASQGERMMMIADGLANIADAGQRVALQRALFGRGGLGLNITGGRQGIQARADRADVLEGETVNSEHALAQIRAYNEAMREMKMVTQAIWTQLGVFIAPFMTGLVRQITNVLMSIRQWMEDHRALVTIVFYAAAALGVLGSAITLIGSIVWVAGGAFGAFASVIGFVWRAVTTLGGALALLQYGSMIIGFGAVSSVVLLARVALYSFKIAVAVATAAQWAYSFALGVYEGITGAAAAATMMMGVATTVAATAAGYSTGAWLGNAIAVKAVAAAAWIYHAAILALTSGLGVFSIVQGIAAIGAASWAWIMSTSFATEMAKAAATWLYIASLTALSATYTFLTVTLWSYTAAEIAAWIWETILTAGTNVLVFALQFLLGTLVLVTGAFAVLAGMFAGVAVGLNLLGVRFGDLHESLSWIDTMADAIVGFFRDLPGYIAAAWNYLVVNPVVTFVRTVIDAFNWLRETAAQVWDGINNIIGAADEDGLLDFAKTVAFAAVGLAILGPLLAYLVYEMDIVGQVIANASRLFTELQDNLQAIGNAILDYVLYPFRQVQALIDSVVAAVQVKLAQLRSWVEEIAAQIIAPFLYVRNAIVQLIASALDWIRGIFNSFAQWLSEKVDALLAPFRELRDRVVAFFAGMFNALAARFSGVVAVGRYVYGVLVQMFNGLSEQLQEAFWKVLEVLVSVLRLFIPLQWQIIFAFLFLRDQIVEVIGQVVDWCKEKLGELAGWIGSLFSGRILQAIRDLWDGIVGVVALSVETLRGAFEALRDYALAPFIALRDWIDATFGELIAAILQPFRDLWARVLASVDDVIAKLRAPIDALVAFLIEAQNRFAHFGGQLWAGLVNTGRQAVASLRTIFGAMGNALSGIWTAFSSGFMEAMGRVVTAASQAGQAIWGHLSRVFGTLREDAVRIWEGIRRAFNAGDWDLIWQIIKAGFSVAWIEIKIAGLQAWAELKTGATQIFSEIGNYLSDAFDDAWLAIKKGWNTAVGEMKATWITFMEEARAQAFEVAAANPLQSAANREQWTNLAAAAREAGRVGAGQARQRAEIDNTNLGRAAAGASIDNQAARVEREMQLDAARAQEMAALAAGNGPALAAARARLAELLAKAQALPSSSQNAAEGFNHRIQESVAGTFSAQAAFGFLGAHSRSESPAERHVRLVESQMRRMEEMHRDMAGWMLELIRRSGARFS